MHDQTRRSIWTTLTQIVGTARGAMKVTPLRRWILLLITVAVALAAWCMGPFNSTLSPEENGNETVPVLIASHFLPAFTPISSHLVEIRLYPKVLVPPGALHAISELRTDSGKEIFSALLPIPEGQPL